MTIPDPSYIILHYKNLAENSNKLYVVRVDAMEDKFRLICSHGATKDEFLKDMPNGDYETLGAAGVAMGRAISDKEKKGYVNIKDKGYGFGLRTADVISKFDKTRLAFGRVGSTPSFPPPQSKNKGPTGPIVIEHDDEIVAPKSAGAKRNERALD